MTLGQKLAGYRKLAGLTQQQLGERLNISAQAISKWEKDLAEPALSTLRTLAELYKVSIDVLLDPDAPLGVPVIDETENEGTDPEATAVDEEAAPQENALPSSTIGFCKHCGIVVNQENVGTTQPTVLCKQCFENLKAEHEGKIALERALKERQAQLAAKKREEQALAQKREKESNRRARKGLRTKSFVWAGLATALFLTIMIAAMVGDFSVGMLFFTLISSYAVFAFISCLFYDCFIQDVVIDWMCKSFQAPGLIFTFDLDGIIWLIGMKILFWAIGIAISLAATAIGIFIGLVCAPFVFPFLMHSEHIGIQNGTAAE